MLSLTGLSKSFRASAGSILALDNTGLDVPAGEIVGLVGRGGAGKTTLLRAIPLLVPPDTGSVLLDGVNLRDLSPPALRQARRRIGMVFERFNLLTSRS